MNIIKLKDKLMPSSLKMSEFFNKNLKGKYAYWIKLQYIVPICDDIDYVALEQSNSKPLNEHIDIFSDECRQCDFANVYVDVNETNNVNGVSKYILANSYVTDEDLDISELRRFRTWLASELLHFNSTEDPIYTNEQIHMLEYYKNGMYNDVVKYLEIFGSDSDIVELFDNTSCGCCNSTVNIFGLNKSFMCNALEIYRNNIHNMMVLTFENIDFWVNANKNFILMFKKYIDNIIKVGFLIENTNSTPIRLCECSVSDNSSNELMLKNLSLALQYIHDNDMYGHKNFIHTSLYNWAEYLYDYMFWDM